jgi:putative SOS response-associated peptidase YedK
LEGGRRRKEAGHEFREPDDDYLWAVGICEENDELGPYHSMVTTAASLLMSPIHDRMPALIRPDEMAEYLAGSGRWDLQSFTGSLVVEPCEIPLAN